MVITESNALKKFCDTIKDSEFITVDTEFLREKTYYPTLCLIQVSGPDKNAVAIDPMAQGLDLRPLFELLFDPNLLKVFHAGRQDLEIFYNLTGRVVAPLFDTQIAAMVCGYGDQVGYEALVRNTTGGEIDKSSQFTDWSLRPLSDKQLNYALSDVTHLCDVYQVLLKQLAENGREKWVYEEEETLMDEATYRIHPHEMWEKVKVKSPKPRTLAILRELAAWREERAQRKNLPRSWVMRDDALSDMAAQAPRDVKALKKIRGISNDFARSSHGKVLLELIKKALDSPREDWPKPKKKKILEPEEAALFDALKMLLKIQASLHGVAPRLIGGKDELEDLARGKENNPLLKGWRNDIFGRYAHALQNGELAVGMKNGMIEKYKVSTNTEIYD